MLYVLKILRKHLANEKNWLRSEALGSIDARMKAGAAMARDRIPQLEQAIEVLQAIKPAPPKKDTVEKITNAKKKTQLNLFTLFK